MDVSSTIYMDNKFNFVDNIYFQIIDVSLKKRWTYNKPLWDTSDVSNIRHMINVCCCLNLFAGKCRDDINNAVI